MSDAIADEDEPKRQEDAPGGRLSGNVRLDDIIAESTGGFSVSSTSPQEVASFQTFPEGAQVRTDTGVQYRVGEVGGREPAPPVDASNVPPPAVASLSASEEGPDTFSATATVSPTASGVLTDFDAFSPENANGLKLEDKDVVSPTNVARLLSAAANEFSEGTHAQPASTSSAGFLAEATAHIEGKSSTSFSGSATRTVYLSELNNDEATSSRRPDILGVTPDATAFAQLAVSRSTQPPLAVGVFGSWGAGKSYFIDLIHAQVANHADKAKPSAERPAAGHAFHDKVIQIRFNAWHYAETNLWASLVGHIFQELSASTMPSTREDVFGKLSTARRLTLEASSALIQARKEQRSAKANLENAKTSLAQAQARPVRTANLFADMMVSAFRDDDDSEVVKARKELQVAASELGVGAVLTSTQELTEEGAALLRHGVQGKEMFWSISKNIGSPWVATLFVLLLVAAPLLVVELMHHASESLQWLRGWVSDALAPAIALASVLAAWFRKASGPLLAGIEKLKAAKARIDAHVAENLDKYEKRVAENEAAVAKASANVQAASELLTATTARVAEAREELHGQSAAGRLINFVRDRAANGEYAKHLGLISTIRKDFEELSNFVSGKATNPQGSDKDEIRAIRRQVAEIILQAKRDKLLTEEEVADLKQLARRYRQKPLPFERIVLYIDDVDRCPPAKVVEVLQAVHMLLAFKLFVVFVAVDVRWVASSLAQQYKEMLKDVNTAAPLTSASDYLEKIFQIPYWLPTVNEPSSDALVSMMLPRAGSEGDVSGTAAEVGAATSAVSSGRTVDSQERFVPIEFSESEIKKIQQFASLLESPRKVIRFTNVVRFMRARERFGQAFASDLETTPILAQLAIATASPEAYSLWLLVARACTGDTIADLIKTLGPGYLARYPIVLRSLRVAQQWLGDATTVDALGNIGSLASRLSFAAPLPDPEGRVFAVIKDRLDSGMTDFPPLDELRAKVT